MLEISDNTAQNTPVSAPRPIPLQQENSFTIILHPLTHHPARGLPRKHGSRPLRFFTINGRDLFCILRGRRTSCRHCRPMAPGASNGDESNDMIDGDLLSAPGMPHVAHTSSVLAGALLRAAAGGISSSLSLSACYPLDTLRTYMQVRGGKAGQCVLLTVDGEQVSKGTGSSLEVLAELVQQRGVAGLYDVRV